MSSTRAKQTRRRMDAPPERPRLPREVRAKLDRAFWGFMRRPVTAKPEPEDEIEQARRQVGGRG